MAKPLGTGIRFKFHEKYYEVGKVEHGKSYGVIDYMCIVGKVVNIREDALWIKTVDNIVVLSDITSDGKKTDLKKTFRNGNLII